MKPKDIEQNVCELVDGLLPVEQAEEVRQRLAADPRLAEEHRLYQSLTSVLDEMAAEPMPLVDWELQRQTIQAAMERDALLTPSVSPWPRRLIRWSAAVTAAAAVFVALLLSRGLLIGPSAPPAPGGLEVAWVLPVAFGEGALDAAPVRPALPATEELAVAYSEPDGVGAGGRSLASALVRPRRPGTIIISAAGPTQASDWTWEDL